MADANCWVTAVLTPRPVVTEQGHRARQMFVVATAAMVTLSCARVVMHAIERFHAGTIGHTHIHINIGHS